MKKIYRNRVKNHLPKGVDHKNTAFGISRNLIRKACFQMTLNARKSCADSFLKIRTEDNRARFSRNQQTVKNSTAKPRNTSW